MLTPKQQRFVEEYLVDLDPAAAYMRAGYKVSAIMAAKKAAELLARAVVQEAIREAKASAPARGRPPTFTQEIADLICDGLAGARSLRSICLDEGMPDQRTVFRWLADDRYADFRQQYARAREAQIEAFVDEMIDIADDGTNDWITRERDDGSTYEVVNTEVVHRSKIRLDTRKWIAAKMMPKKYGDAATVKLADAEGEKLELGDVERATRLAAIFAQIEQRRADSDAD